MNCRLSFALGVALAVGAAFADGETAWSGPVTIDSRAQGVAGRRVLSPAPIGYSADWVLGRPAPNARCVMTRTARTGVPGCVTETVVDAAAGAEGVYSLMPDAAGERVFTVTLQALEGSAVLGTLTTEVALGLQAAAANDVRMDAGDGKLQRVVDEGAQTADLLCDTSWVEGAASAVITKTTKPWTGKRTRGVPVVETETYTAPFDGAYAQTIAKGEDCEFSLVFRDANGQATGDPLLACYSKSVRFGLVLTVR